MKLYATAKIVYATLVQIKAESHRLTIANFFIANTVVMTDWARSLIFLVSFQCFWLAFSANLSSTLLAMKKIGNCWPVWLHLQKTSLNLFNSQWKNTTNFLLQWCTTSMLGVFLVPQQVHEDRQEEEERVHHLRYGRIAVISFTTLYQFCLCIIWNCEVCHKWQKISYSNKNIGRRSSHRGIQVDYNVTDFTKH